MSLKRPRTQRILAIAVAVTAALLIVVGLLTNYKVYDAEAEEFGLVAFMRVSDQDMTVDATFGGVTRRDGRLYSTYDRSAPRGKQACPT